MKMVFPLWGVDEVLSEGLLFTRAQPHRRHKKMAKPPQARLRETALPAADPGVLIATV